MKIIICQILFVIKILMVIYFTVMTTSMLSAEELPSPKIAILISIDIKPYAEAVEGLRVMTDEKWQKENHFSVSPDLEIFSLEKFSGKRRDILKEDLIEGKFDLFVAVGPESLRFVTTEFKDSNIPIIYTMVLNPEDILSESDKFCDIPLRIPTGIQIQEIVHKLPCLNRLGLLYDPLYANDSDLEAISSESDKFCGIPLCIPISIQIREIVHKLPCLNRLGLLYDPKYNDLFFKEAYKYGEPAGLKIIPLKVSSKKEIPLILRKNWDKIDSLWIIPDSTVISESLIQYIIKEAILKKKPVIGYNHFFYESGSAMVFLFDYEEIGKQTAKLTLEILSEKRCKETYPEFDILLNERVIKKLGIQGVQE